MSAPKPRMQSLGERLAREQDELLASYQSLDPALFEPAAMPGMAMPGDTNTPADTGGATILAATLTLTAAQVQHGNVRWGAPTVGTISEPSIVTSRSKAAPASVASPRQRVSARSSCSPDGA